MKKVLLTILLIGAIALVGCRKKNKTTTISNPDIKQPTTVTTADGTQTTTVTAADGTQTTTVTAADGKVMSIRTKKPTP